MPTYGYECLSCDNQFEIFQSIKDDPLKTCESCGGTLRKRVYPVGIAFKGSGFYVNDYAPKAERLQRHGGRGKPTRRRPRRAARPSPNGQDGDEGRDETRSKGRKQAGGQNAGGHGLMCTSTGSGGYSRLEIAARRKVSTRDLFSVPVTFLRLRSERTSPAP